MHKIDPTHTWKKVEERLSVETSPRRRKVLETVLTHMKAEAVGDVEGLMQTLNPNPRYQFFGEDGDTGPKGADAVRKFYNDFVASDCQRLEFAVDRLVVDDDCVLTEGVMRMAYPGRVLRALGHAVDDDDAYYLYEAHMAILWPMDEDGLAIGEDSYVGENGFKDIEQRKIPASEVPDVLHAA